MWNVDGVRRVTVVLSAFLLLCGCKTLGDSESQLQKNPEAATLGKFDAKSDSYFTSPEGECLVTVRKKDPTVIYFVNDYKHKATSAVSIDGRKFSSGAIASFCANAKVNIQSSGLEVVCDHEKLDTLALESRGAAIVKLDSNNEVTGIKIMGEFLNPTTKKWERKLDIKCEDLSPGRKPNK